VTTYTVPDSPADPAAAALELLVRFPGTILHTDAFRSVLQDYAGALDAEGAFTGLSWSDAKNIAAEIAFDLTQRDDASGGRAGNASCLETLFRKFPRRGRD